MRYHGGPVNAGEFLCVWAGVKGVEGRRVKAFIGTFVNKIDAKGRISVPASFRAVVQARGLSGVALYPSLIGEKCIEGCGLDHIEKLADDQPDNPLPPVDQDAI